MHLEVFRRSQSHAQGKGGAVMGLSAKPPQMGSGMHSIQMNGRFQSGGIRIMRPIRCVSGMDCAQIARYSLACLKVLQASSQRVVLKLCPNRNGELSI
jgi:hypothetical protein